ncbi:MAG: hypothetical protein FVQ83_01405 [Chloroflexi bacterium]|nr:hypothetical protein [Chloroflexota bacterium]
MQSSARELWLSLLAILLIGSIYVSVIIYTGSIPAAGEFFGHSLGILGFILMLMTEILYSVRKRSRSARWGRTSAWLQFHIFTGLVGPFLVVLHSSWIFNGLAGVVTLLTIIIAGSGFIGRYIYTAVPRTADGVMVEGKHLEKQIATAEAELRRLGDTQPVGSYNFIQLISAAALPKENTFMFLFGRFISNWNFRFKFWRAKRKMNSAARVQANKLEKLIYRHRVLKRQVASLALVRHFLAIWHSVHIPLGVALFIAGFIHMFAALYYSTFLH